jgi:hypothetical protein
MVQSTLQNYNPEIHTISARIETITKVFSHTMLQNSFKKFMPQGSWALPPTDSRRLYLIRPDDAPVTFVCSGSLKQGALLYLPFLADREETNARGDFSKWIIKNIDGCYKVAEDLGCGVNRMEDIILVTGRHLARSWVSAAFSSSCRGGEVSFRIRLSGDSGVHLVERDVSGGELKLGPTGEVSFEPEHMLRNLGPDTSHTRAYQRTNAFSFKGTASPASSIFGEGFGRQDWLLICMNLNLNLTCILKL